MLVIIVLPLFLVYSYHVGYYGFASFPCIQLPRFVYSYHVGYYGFASFPCIQLPRFDVQIGIYVI